MITRFLSLPALTDLLGERGDRVLAPSAQILTLDIVVLRLGQFSLE